MTFSLSGPFPIRRLTTFLVLLTGSGVVLAANATDQQLHFMQMGFGLFGGLALFMAGLDQMADALKAIAGEGMKTLLARLTHNRVIGAITGAFVTAVIQSSSVTTVLVVGFITAGAMTLQQSVGVIMGANIGSTFTAQLVAFKITEAALPLIAIGFLTTAITKRDTLKQVAAVTMGLGVIFLGMGLMSDAMYPLRSYEPFITLMKNMENPVIGILIGAGFTALVQSSAVTTGIAVILASQGFLTLPAGIALALGSNIGTCVTALLAAIGKPVDAVRAAVVHVLFNILGVLFWVFFIETLAAIVMEISPQSTELTGKERLAADTPRQIANAHTTFNVINTLVFIPFTGWFAKLAVRLVPDKGPGPLAELKPKFLDEITLDTPALALNQARNELADVGERVVVMLDSMIPALEAYDLKQVDAIDAKEEEVDVLHAEIASFLREVGKRSLGESDARTHLGLIGVNEEIEDAADLIVRDLTPLMREEIEERPERDMSAVGLLQKLHHSVTENFKDALQAIQRDDVSMAHKIVGRDKELERIAEEAFQYLSAKLSGEDLDKFRRKLAFGERMIRLNRNARQIALDVLSIHGERIQL